MIAMSTYLGGIMKRFGIILVFVCLILVFVTACSTSAVTSPKTTHPTSLTTSPAINSPSPSAGVETIRLVGTIGPLTIPLAYMKEKNVLSSVANQTTLDIWSTPAQLQSIITGGQGDFIELPTNSAATFYNKGVSLKLLDSSIWNILYLVTIDSSIQSIHDLKGTTVVVPYQGAVPDAMFRFICTKQGINPETDINILYSPDPVQASQLILTGQQKYALLSEPSATSVILKGKSSQMSFIRALNMQNEWKKATGGANSTPIAGTIVAGPLADRPDIINVFNTEYQKAIQWMLGNPVEAGNVGARALTEQGFTANVLTEAMKNIDWNYVTAQNARTDLEAFFNALSQITPNFIGGKLPDEGFYYQP